MEPACMNGRQSTKLAAYIAVSVRLHLSIPREISRIHVLVQS